MENTTAIDHFYKFNNIKPEQYASSQMEAYTQNKLYDSQILQENLEDRISCWIKRFDEDEREYFYSLFEN